MDEPTDEELYRVAASVFTLPESSGRLASAERRALFNAGKAHERKRLLPLIHEAFELSCKAWRAWDVDHDAKVGKYIGGAGERLKSLLKELGDGEKGG